MQFAHALFAAAALAAIVPAPAQAGHHHGAPSSSGDSTASAGPASSGGTSIPEPSDAILVLMGAAGVVIGRKLHARARRKAE